MNHPLVSSEFVGRIYDCALDAVSAGALIVDPNGQIVYVNARAEAELDRGALLARDALGRLRGATAQAEGLVRALQACAASAGAGIPFTKLADGKGHTLVADALRFGLSVV